MFCGTCGKEIRDDSKFCEFCGTPVAIGQAGKKTPVMPENTKLSKDFAENRQQKPIKEKAEEHGMPPTASKRKSKKTGILLAAGTVLLLAAAGGIWLLGGADVESGSATTEAEKMIAERAETEAQQETDSAAETEVFRFAEETEAAKAETQGAENETEAETETAEKAEETVYTETVDFTEYILPDCASRLYTEEELSALSEEDLRLARNEIYARHGRKFQTEDLNAYFSGKTWYVPLYSAEEMNQMGDSYLNAYETANRDRILQVESARKGERPMQVIRCQESITLRSAPSTTAGEICQIPLGAIVTYKGAAEGQFYEIEYEGYRGYAIGSYFAELS